ncbi:MAG: TSUP family transporter, partial [Betaproteobacteria bacterium AqS2]|nr:TSUP family transporter [Betaproteobacteria bacterium AqS2]
MAAAPPPGHLCRAGNLDWIVYAAVAAIGCAGGVFAGLLGIGGGLIMTPLMLFVFEHLGYDPAAAALAAIATNLAAIFFTSAASTTVHALHGAVDWRLLAWLAPATLLGAAAAAQVALLVPPALLIGLFLALLIYACWRLLAGGRAGAAP